VARRQVISMLEFLRTGKLAGITCGCTAEDIVAVLGPPDYEAQSPFIENSSWFRYDSLEVWFHAKTRIVNRLTLQRFRHFRDPKHSHSFQQSIPQITRAKIDPWVLRESLELETAKRFLKTANLEYKQSQWEIGVDQLDLQSGVYLLFDPAQSDDAGLSYLGISDNELIEELYSESVQNQVNSGKTS
jgi:hypothetical protein